MTLARCGAATLSFWLVVCSQSHAQLPMLCPGEVIELDTSAASKPFVRMHLGTHQGNFLIDTGATYSNVDASLYGVAPGTTITLRGSSLPTLESGSFNAIDLSQETPFAPPGGHAGTIGTNIPHALSNFIMRACAHIWSFRRSAVARASSRTQALSPSRSPDSARRPPGCPGSCRFSRAGPTSFGVGICRSSMRGSAR
jgi:hypothetical protein